MIELFNSELNENREKSQMDKPSSSNRIRSN